MKTIFITIASSIAVVCISIVVFIVFDRLVGETSHIEVRSEENLVCSDDTGVSVTYYEDDSVAITLDGVTYRLNQVVSASGARYANSDESFVFWNKGDTSMLIFNDEVAYEACHIPGAIPRQETYTTEEMEGYTVRFDIADDFAVRTEDNRYLVEYVASSSGSDSDGEDNNFILSLRIFTIDEGDTLEAFAKANQSYGENITDTATSSVEIDGKQTLRFEYEASDNSTVVEYYVDLDEETAARIMISVNGGDDELAQTAADLVNSFVFERKDTESSVLEDN